MKSFLDKDFLLHTETAKLLYHEYAQPLPIIDYHNHLSPHDIAIDKRFANLTQVWLNDDHYKWRAMRTNGVQEKYITGNASDFEKFQKWAETVPYTMRNPLYHWTHMELKNIFGIEKIVNVETAEEIFKECSEMLIGKDFSTREILRKSKVELLCTTDDPTDSLEFHEKCALDNFGIKVFPTFRPDKAMEIGDIIKFNAWVDKLALVVDKEIENFSSYLDAIKSRHDFFHSIGCRISDHGLETIYAEEYSDQEIESIFKKARAGKILAGEEILKFKSAMLYHLAILDHEKKWAQQFHIGALRNNNERMMHSLGADSGFDSMGDFEIARPMAKFFSKLDRTDQLAKTIIYNINPRDNELFATMIGNFNDGSIQGKMQYGASWWFLDQKDGIEKQLNTISNLGLLSRFIGMVTDSRSFLSFPRHEYFRRIVCNAMGTDIENGELPNDPKHIGSVIQDICYYNAKRYFDFK